MGDRGALRRRSAVVAAAAAVTMTGAGLVPAAPAAAAGGAGAVAGLSQLITSGLWIGGGLAEIGAWSWNSVVWVPQFYPVDVTGGPGWANFVYGVYGYYADAGGNIYNSWSPTSSTAGTWNISTNDAIDSPFGDGGITAGNTLTVNNWNFTEQINLAGDIELPFGLLDAGGTWVMPKLTIGIDDGIHLAPGAINGYFNIPVLGIYWGNQPFAAKSAPAPAPLGSPADVARFVPTGTVGLPDGDPAPATVAAPVVDGAVSGAGAAPTGWVADPDRTTVREAVRDAAHGVAGDVHDAAAGIAGVARDALDGTVGAVPADATPDEPAPAVAESGAPAAESAGSATGAP